jgi:hypothetical protein
VPLLATRARKEKIGSEEEERDRGIKGHFTIFLSPQKLKMNILLGPMSTSKFDKVMGVFGFPS